VRSMKPVIYHLSFLPRLSSISIRLQFFPYLPSKLEKYLCCSLRSELQCAFVNTVQRSLATDTGHCIQTYLLPSSPFGRCNNSLLWGDLIWLSLRALRNKRKTWDENRNTTQVCQRPDPQHPQASAYSFLCHLLWV